MDYGVRTPPLGRDSRDHDMLKFAPIKPNWREIPSAVTFTSSQSLWKRSTDTR